MINFAMDCPIQDYAEVMVIFLDGLNEQGTLDSHAYSDFGSFFARAR